MAGDGPPDTAAWQATAGIPYDEGGPVFAAPWEAQAFAMTLALEEQGLFGWEEWAAALGEEIRLAQEGGDPDLGDTYYAHWLRALERLVAGKQITTAESLQRCRDAWARAAERTPHGSPIELRPDDFEGGS
ncbi:MAG: nitrile hydratase accessory protein [Acidimicrobiaceae bacterium]|nr:nitrile hydratase accessory protein [Acidimicrobiaceae bacterium]